MPIKNYSTVASNNNATPPNGAPEGATYVNQLTDIIRQERADIREWYETPGWRDLGHTPTFVSSTSFSVTGNQTASYFINQRIRITDTSTLYGTISNVAFTTVTTVTVTLDSGSITSSISAVAVGLGDANRTVHYSTIAGTPATVVSSVDLAAPAEFSVSGNPITSSGTITIAKANQSANLVYAGPTSGGAAAPSFRTVVAADLPAATTSAQGASQLADAATSRTGTSTTRTMTPSVVRDHPAAIKAYFTGSISGGVLTTANAYGCSVSRNSAGVFDVTFSTTMQDANYTVVAIGGTTGTQAVAYVDTGTAITTSGFRLHFRNPSTGTLTDLAVIYFMVCGN